ncbi:MAG: AAA family ATPase [Betaproteobacteria bacterium]|nr:AAA family ATPase [Betaproteobacteria bacterium]
MIVHASDIELADYMADPDFSPQVRTADDYLEQLKRIFAGTERTEAAATLGWPKTYDLIAFRAEEITLWAGSNGSRKSMMLGQFALDLAQQAYRSLTISLEMPARKTLERMFRQASASSRPNAAECDHAAAVMRDRVFLFDHVGVMGVDRLSAVLRWANAKLQVQHVIIDSMTKVVRGDDDYSAQKEFVDRMTEVAKETGLHLHIVVHTRKPSDHIERMPTKWDIKGSSSVSDLAHNVVVLWRNRAKEAAPEKDSDAPDQMLDVQKQRNGEFEGRINLWFDPKSMQFLKFPGSFARPYIAQRRLQEA